MGSEESGERCGHWEFLRTRPREGVSAGMGTAHLHRVHHILTEVLKGGVELIGGDSLDIL